MKYIKFVIILSCSLSLMAKELMDKVSNVYFVVLAGGSGERLWPLSRKKTPKQLLSVDSSKTLLEQAIDRICPLAKSREQIWIVTSKRFETEIRNNVGSMVGTIVIEPEARNTGPAILYACLQLHKINPNAIVVFLPADQFIPTSENKNFTDYLMQAINFVKHKFAVALLGVKPIYPATGYGYIEYANLLKSNLYKVVQFHEKPTVEHAEKYIKANNMLWNIGIFCGNVSTFIKEYQQVAPELFNDVIACEEGKKTFDKIQSISVDYAVIERSKNIWVLPSSFSWCDVGNISVFLNLKQRHKGLDNNLIQVDSHNNLVDVPDKLVALIGVDDLCIVQTSDALLVTRRDEAEKVRSIVNYLKQEELIDYL